MWVKSENICIFSGIIMFFGWCFFLKWKFLLIVMWKKVDGVGICKVSNLLKEGRAITLCQRGNSVEDLNLTLKAFRKQEREKKGEREGEERENVISHS